MPHRDCTITNEAGLHARPAALFVKTANLFRSDIWVEKGDEEVNGKSIMGLMMLAAESGATLRITAEGDDAEEALAALGELLERGFDEVG
jgi:phosphocarrier protein HPr